MLDHVEWEDAVMQEEIFGPILPVLTYEKLEDALSWINQRPKPLALYCFTENKKVEENGSGEVPVWRWLHQRHTDSSCYQ